MIAALVVAAVAARASALSNPMKDCCKMPLKVGFYTESFDPFYLWDDETQARTGGLLAIEEMILDVMGFDVEWVPMGTVAEAKTFAGLSSGAIDAVFAYGPLFLPTPFHVSEPIFTFENRAMIRKERVQRDDLASIFGPFAPNLWYAIVGAIVFVAVVLWLMDRISHPAEAARKDSGVIEERDKKRSYLYRASTLVLAHDDETHTPASPAALLFRVACIFIAVIISATYTANLAAFLTHQEFKVVGPQTLAELRRSHACNMFGAMATLTGDGGWRFTGNLVRSTHEWPPGVAFGDTPRLCQELLDAGEVDVVIGDWPTQRAIELGDPPFRDLGGCDKRVVLDFPLPGPYHAAIFAPHLGALSKNFSLAVDAAKYDAAYTSILVDYFRADGSCKADALHDERPPKIQFRDMLGLFLTLGTAGVASLGLALLERVNVMAWIQSCVC